MIPTTQIAQTAGVTLDAILKRAKKLGLTPASRVGSVCMWSARDAWKLEHGWAPTPPGKKPKKRV